MLVILPSVEVFARIFKGTGIVASSVIVQHLTLWIGFSGAIIAARKNRLLSLTSTPLFNSESTIKVYNYISKVISIFIVFCLAYGAWHLVKVEMSYPVKISPLIPRWSAQLIMPIGFLLIALHLIQNSYDLFKHRLYLITSVAFLVLLFNFNFFRENSFSFWIVFVFLILSLYRGAPIFIGRRVSFIFVLE